MSNAAIAYMTYAGVLVSMLVFGSLMQAQHIQYGLVASQFAIILLPALVLRARTKERAPLPSFRSFGATPSVAVWVLSLIHI